jgi:hypothetical protein
VYHFPPFPGRNAQEQEAEARRFVQVRQQGGLVMNAFVKKLIGAIIIALVVDQIKTWVKK